MTVETELKLGLDARLVRRFLKHPVLLEDRPVRQRLLSIYFDTPDFELLRSGVALRVRRVGRQWIQTVKARAGAAGVLTQRPEWEIRVRGRGVDIDALPPEAAERIPPAIRPRLQPVFETAFTRVTWQIRLGRSRIELALDRGTIRAGERTMPISEVELELKAGPVAGLFRLATRLLEDVPFHMEPGSKAQRAYQLAGVLPVTPVRAIVPELAADMPATHAYVAIVRSCQGQFEANLPGLLEGGDVEFLHQMRVALRRLRAVIGLIGHLGLPRPPWADEVRWLMGELSPARDWDVLVTQTLPSVEADMPDPARLKPLLAAAHSLREQAQARARKAALSPGVVRLWLAIEQSLLRFPALEVTTLEWARAALDRHARRVRRRGQHLQRLDVSQRHALRIAAKKLRYAGEFFASLRPGRSERFLSALARVQDDLGVLNDQAVTQRLLDEGRAMAGDAVLEGCRVVTAFLDREMRARSSDLNDAWAAFRKQRHDL